MSGMFFDFLSVGILLGAMHAFFLAFYLLSIKKGNFLSFRILSALLISMGIGMSGSVLHEADFFLSRPTLGSLFPLNEFLYGPLFFLYVRSMLNPDFSWKASCFLHFIPAILFIFLHLAPELSFPVLGEQLKILISIQFLVYLFLSLKVWLQHVGVIQNYYSSLEKIRVDWLRNILLGMGVVYLLSLLSFWFNSAEVLKLAPLFGAVLIYVTAYLGMKHARLFTVLEGIKAEPLPPEVKTVKYQNSGLDEGRKSEIKRKMRDLMEQEKLFTDNDLTLPKLAQKVGVSTHHLSQVLNENIGQTFFDYVNEFRVREVQRLITDPACANLTFLGMAMEAGFNSKSAFNTAFKKHTKQTPLQYKKSLTAENL